MHKGFASTKRCLESTDGPVQGSGLTSLDFFRSLGEHFGRE
jgi:hypothetical protein